MIFEITHTFCSLQSMDGGWESRSRDAQAHVHPPRLAFDRGTVDAESRLIPQAETDEQH